MFSGSRYGTCQCKPKHCKELEGRSCKYDEDCGEGGYCRERDILG